MSETTTEATTVQTNESLIAAAWGDTPPATATVETTGQVEQGAETATTQTAETTTQTAAQQANDDVVDADEYLRQNLGYESWDAAKQEIEELKKLKEAQQANEIKFANDESEKLFKALQEGKEDEIFEVLSKKQEFKRIEKLDVTNPKDASELIKANLKLKHPQLDPTEIEDIFQENYYKSPKPTQRDDQTDEEYQEALEDWKLRTEAIDRKMVRDAKIAKPEVLSLQSKIVIPDIPTNNSQAAGQTQEDLEAFTKAKESFVKSAETVLKDFNGFVATVKDKDVEIPVNYDLSKDEKDTLSGYVKNFAERLDANVLFAERWLDKEGNIKTEQVIKDLSKVLFDDNKSQKFVNDAAAKRLELYLKDKKKVDVSGGSNSRTTFEPTGEQAQLEKLRESVWNS